MTLKKINVSWEVGTNCSPKKERKIQEVEKDKDEYLDEYGKSKVLLVGYVLECIYLEVYLLLLGIKNLSVSMLTKLKTLVCTK